MSIYPPCVGQSPYQIELHISTRVLIPTVYIVDNAQILVGFEARRFFVIPLAFVPLQSNCYNVKRYLTHSYDVDSQPLMDLQMIILHIGSEACT